MNTCSICGSDRLMPGPAYEPDNTRCLDCGSAFNVPTRTIPDPKVVRSQISEEVKFPEGGFSTPEEAAAHLAKLKEAAKRLGKSTVETEDRVNKPKRKSHPSSNYPPELVMAELHYFQRKGESFNEVMSTGKGERAVRNTNCLIFCHNHISGHQCTASCREVIGD